MVNAFQIEEYGTEEAYVVYYADKKVGIGLARDEKLFIVDFWNQGILLAEGRSSHWLDMVDAITDWLTCDVTSTVFSNKFQGINPTAIAEAFDENKEIEFSWNRLLQSEQNEPLGALIALAADEVLQTLFPYMSLYTLLLSRCTGYPYDSQNLPTVTPAVNFFDIETQERQVGTTTQVDVQYVVADTEMNVLGKGTAKEAIAMIKTYIPADIQPATKGFWKQTDLQ